MHAVMMLVVPRCLYSVAAKHPFCWALRRMMHRPWAEYYYHYYYYDYPWADYDSEKKLLLKELIACREREGNIDYLGQVLGEGVLKGKLLGAMRTSVSDGRGIVKVDYVTTSYF